MHVAVVARFFKLMRESKRVYGTRSDESNLYRQASLPYLDSIATLTFILFPFSDPERQPLCLLLCRNRNADE